MKKWNLTFGKEDNTSYSTRFEVSGAIAEVEAWWSYYCGCYHPAGYGTSRTKVSEADGNVTYKIYRSLSCD